MPPFTRGLLGVLLIVALPVAVGAQEGEMAEMRALIEQGQYERALGRLDAYLIEHPGDPQGRFLKGIALTEQDRIDEAIEMFAALAEEYPRLPEPHNNLAVLYAARGEYVKARDALLVAINTHPSYATAHENLGDIFAKMAGLAYDRALELDRDNETAKAKLALMHDLISVSRGDSPSFAVSTMPEVETRVTAEPVAVAAAPEPEPAPASQDSGLGDVRHQVLGALQSWAEAWASQDVEGYLNAYAGVFRPPDGQARAEWEALRRERLERPQFISIDIDSPRVDVLAEDEVKVTFLQAYQSDTYADRVRKVIGMTKEGGRWLIVSEMATE